MVKLVASRVAAIRLVWIIAVLMVPIIMLGYLLVQSIQEGISFNQKEARGMEFLNLVTPVMLDAAENKVQSENYDKLLKFGATLAEPAGVRGVFEPLRRELSNSNVDPRAVLKASHELILQTGELSNIILDPQSETYYLGTAIVQGMPDLIMRFKQLQYATAASNIKVLDSLFLVSSIDGRMQEAQRLLGSQLHSAKAASHSGFDYIPILADFDMIEKYNISRSMAIKKSFTGASADFDAMQTSVTAMPDTGLNMHRSLWKKTIERFSTLNNAQSQALSKRMSIAVLASFLSVLLGIGSAITMFQSTLKRLDEISQSKLDADKARDEAEQMASALTVINSDMAGMNRELADQMQKLKEAQDALVNKGRMEQLGQLTATIAHELRNPLGAVRTSAFLIERKIKGKELGLENQLLRINNGVSRCDDIITQLLDFSRTRPLASRPADLDQWLVQTIEEEARQLPSAVAIECVLDLQGRDVPFDAARLQRAIINLMSNAAEAMVGKGDDPSKFETKVPRITVSTSIVDDHAVITVKDNGPGISSENIEKIREPLYTTKSFGTGLGLPAVEQIAKQHNGRLEIESTLGDGATFKIYLPLHEQIEVAA